MCRHAHTIFFSHYMCLCQVFAARLTSRLRQVVGGVVAVSTAADAVEHDWSIGHAWGALSAVDDFLTRDKAAFAARLSLLAATPSGLESLRAVLHFCAQLAPPSPLPPPSSAETLFLEAEAARLHFAQEPSAAVGRLTADDRAAREAAAALNLKGEARGALRREAQAQARRQLDATCRRRWKLLAPAERRTWERRAAQVRRTKHAPLASHRDCLFRIPHTPDQHLHLCTCDPARARRISRARLVHTQATEQRERRHAAVAMTADLARRLADGVTRECLRY